MSYTPPVHNLVLFNFTVGAYSPPAHNLVLFNFGSVPLPPANAGASRQAVLRAEDVESGVDARSWRYTPPVPSQLVLPYPARLRTPENEPERRPRWAPHTTFLVTSNVAFTRRLVTEDEPEWRARWGPFANVPVAVASDDLIVSIIW